MKARVYIETSVISYLRGRPSQDTIVLAHQELTNSWWNDRSPLFDLLVSQLVYQEASAGNPDAANARLEAIANLRILEITAEAISLAQLLITKGPIPSENAADALHISIAAVNGVDYLLTWNCKHLANAALRGRITLLVEEAGYTCPVICTPEELMED